MNRNNGHGLCIIVRWMYVIEIDLEKEANTLNLVAATAAVVFVSHGLTIGSLSRKLPVFTHMFSRQDVRYF